MKRTNKIFLFLLIAEILFLFGFGLKVKWDIDRLDSKIIEEKDKIKQIETENERLREIEKNLDNPFFIEKLAREKLGLAKKGEVIYKIVPMKTPSP